MKPLFYILKKSTKNYIKDLKKKPAALIAYILFGALLIAVIAMSIFHKSPSSKKMVSKETYSLIMGAIVLIFAYMNIKFSTSKGMTFFRMADVNLVFTSPISPKRVLLYGFLKQIKGILLMIVFLAFQIPSIRLFLPIQNYGIIILFLGIAILTFSLSVMGMLIYSITSKSKKHQKVAERIINGLIGLLIVIYLAQLIRIKDVVQAAVSIFSSSLYMYMPFIGWFQGFFNGAVNGINMSFVIYTVILIVFIGIMIYILYKSETDYYEDVLSCTEYVEGVYKARKQGKTLAPNKVRKIRQGYKGDGAKAIFYRQILEYKKVGMLFFDKSTLIMIVSGVMFGYFVHKGEINTVLYFTAYMLLFTVPQGKWSQELSKPFIYLIPAKSWSKVFYATLADNIKNFVNGLALFVTVGIMFKANPFIILLCVLSYTSFGCVYIYSDVLGRRLFGKYSNVLSNLLRMLITVLIVSPGIIAFIIISVMNKDVYIMKFLSYGLLIGYNMIVAVVLLSLNKGIFENLEMQ